MRQGGVTPTTTQCNSKFAYCSPCFTTYNRKAVTTKDVPRPQAFGVIKKWMPNTRPFIAVPIIKYSSIVL
jgi:hypothetical protein